MIAKRSTQKVALGLAILAVALSGGFWQPRTTAQNNRPVLFSHEDSTRAIAVDSVTSTREPFSVFAPIAFGADQTTRVMLFAGNLHLQTGEAIDVITADAEDGAHHIFPLQVEHVGPVPNQDWATAVILRLSDDMADAGDVLVRVYYHGVASNRVRVAIGHSGGGPADDAGAVPTPGPFAPNFPGSTAATAGTLTTTEVQTIIAQAVSAAASINKAVTVAVTDREGNVLGVFAMTGAPATMQFRGGGPLQTPDTITGLVPVGLEGTKLPSKLGAISKAGTSALFSTSGNAFTTRTASFIIQEHFPPGVAFQGGGPLYGVQFSSLPCSDIKIPGLPLGLSGDPGSMPIYKNGIAQGGVGIEGDGVYGIDRDVSDSDVPFEELIAVSAVRGFETPPLIRGDNILANGIRLPFVNASQALTPATIAFGSLPGLIDPLFPIRAAQPSAFTAVTVGGISGEADPRFYPFVASAVSGGLTAADVDTIISHAAQQANITRAAIRQPLGSNARVSITVVDTTGKVLGLFRQQDAPVFGFDVSVQKARSAAFFSSATAAATLRTAGMGSYVDRAIVDGVRLDGAVAFTDRAVGFLHRPFFPDGLNPNPAGPFSTEIAQWSVFNLGLQLDLIKTNLQAAIGGASVPCTTIPRLPNGIQIFPGSVPLYKNGLLVGAVGISGDGVDQDDIISAGGGNGFSPAPAIRSDQIFVRGVRLPFLKFPRSPNL